MKLSINPKTFIKEFVDPVNDINKEGKMALFSDQENNEIYSVVRGNKQQQSITLYSRYKCFDISDEIDRITINVTRLIKGLECIDTDELLIDLNFDQKEQICSFNSANIKFNVKLLADNMVAVPKFSVDVFNQFAVHHIIPVGVDSVINIKRALAFSSETGKFYIEQEGEKVYLYFGDKGSTSNHTDSIRVMIATGIKTQIPNMIYDIELLKMILKTKNDFTMNINNNGVLFIEIQNSNSTLKYITSPLKK